MKPDNHAAGFTLAEVAVAAVILAAMVLMAGSLSMTGTDTQEFARRLNRATETTQSIASDLRLELVSSVRIFGADTAGTDYLDTFDLAAAPPRLPQSRLPSVKTSSSIEPDSPGNEITGNMLFFARLSWTDRYRCASGNDYRVDVYRWTHYYLTEADGGPAPSRPGGLDFVRVVSEPLADAAQIQRITDPADQAELLMHLAQGSADVDGKEHDATQVVWDRSGDPNLIGTFRQIDPANGSLSDNPIAPRPSPWQIEPAATDGVRGLLAFRHHAVASVHALPAMGVGRFAIRDTSGSGFPHGFEVQVVGPSAARQVLLRFVVVSTNRRGQTAWSAFQGIADARDI